MIKYLFTKRVMTLDGKYVTEEREERTMDDLEYQLDRYYYRNQGYEFMEMNGVVFIYNVEVQSEFEEIVVRIHSYKKEG